MIAEYQSRSLINNPEVNSQRSTPYIIIASQGSHFRILGRELIYYRALVGIWAVFWSFLTLIFGFLVYCSLQQKGPLPVFFLFAVEMLMQALIAYLRRKWISKIAVACSISCFLLSVSLCILVTCSISLTIVPCLLFSLSIIILVAQKVKRKGKLMLLGLVLSQFCFISAKFDNLTSLPWKAVLIPLFSLSLLCFLFLIVLGTYTIVLKCRYPQSYEAKKFSLLFLVSSIFGINCILFAILGQVYFSLPLTLLSGFSLCQTSMIAMFLWLFNNEIAMAFCQHKQRVTEADKELKVELVPLSKVQDLSLFRYSQNWFGKVDKEPQEQIAPNFLPECIICTENKSDIVWLPCGHLTLCTPCSQDMLTGKMLSCPLCKQRPQQICKIIIQSPGQLSVQKQIGLQKECKNSNKYEVSEWYQIKMSL